MPVTHLTVLEPVGSMVAQAVSNAVVPVTKPGGVEAAFIQATGGNVRYTMEGSTPANGGPTGYLLYNNQPPYLIHLGENVTTLRFIREGGTDAVVQITYFRNV